MARDDERAIATARWLPRRQAVVALSLSAVLVGIFLIVSTTAQGQRWNDDVSLYLAGALALVRGQLDATTAVPLYPPFLSTYPPLSLVPMAVPLLISSELRAYAFLFGVEMCLIAGLGVLLLAPVARRGPLRLSPIGPFEVYAAYALLCAFVIPLRWDIVPTTLVLGGLAAASGGGPLLAGALIGTGAAVKLYPAVLVPVLIGWYWYRADRRSALLAAAGFIAAGIVGAGLFLLFPGASSLELLRAQSGRGLEMETLLGSALAALGSAGVLPGVDVVYANGSFNLTGPGVGGALQATSVVEPIALLLAMAALAVRFHRDRLIGALGVPHLLYGMALVFVTLLLTNRVFSPQYMVWLLPFVPFLGRSQQSVALLAAGLTMLIFPFLYEPLIQGMPAVVGLLLARNVALLLLLAMLARDVVTGHIPREVSPTPDQAPAASASVGSA